MNFGILDKMMQENVRDKKPTKKSYLEMKCDNLNKKNEEKGKYVIVKKNGELYIEWREK